jgi:ribonuclease HI
MCNCDGPEGGENQIGWTDVKRIIMTESLSNIVAQEETFTRGYKDLMAEEGSNLKLIWVPAHVGIKGNETADKTAREALKVDNTYKVVKLDLSKWVKRKSWQIRQDEWKPHGDG